MLAFFTGVIWVVRAVCGRVFGCKICFVLNLHADVIIAFSLCTLYISYSLHYHIFLFLPVLVRCFFVRFSYGSRAVPLRGFCFCAPYDTRLLLLTLRPHAVCMVLSFCQSDLN